MQVCFYLPFLIPKEAIKVAQFEQDAILSLQGKLMLIFCCIRQSSQQKNNDFCACCNLDRTRVPEVSLSKSLPVNDPHMPSIFSDTLQLWADD